MNLRPGFRAISDGWLLVEDFNDLTDRIERLAAWSKDNGPLLPDEKVTIEKMIDTQIRRYSPLAGFLP